MSPRNAILIGDALTRLRELPAGSIDCAITSPPYFGLRDYGVDGQLGQETAVDDWACEIRDVCRELFRVLAPHGVKRHRRMSVDRHRKMSVDGGQLMSRGAGLTRRAIRRSRRSTA